MYYPDKLMSTSIFCETYRLLVSTSIPVINRPVINFHCFINETIQVTIFNEASCRKPRKWPRYVCFQDDRNMFDQNLVKKANIFVLL